MFTKKIDLDKHVMDFRSRLKTDVERKIRGLNFAKLYYLHKDYKQALKYLKEYLSVKDDCASGYKLQGKIYEHLLDLKAAFQSYKKSFIIDDTQKDVFDKILKLISDSSIDLETSKLWTEKAQQTFQDKNDKLIFLEKIKDLSPFLSTVSPDVSINKSFFEPNPEENLQSFNSNESTPLSEKSKLKKYSMGLRADVDKLEKKLCTIGQNQQVLMDGLNQQQESFSKLNDHICSSLNSQCQLISLVINEIKELKQYFLNELQPCIQSLKDSNIYINDSLNELNTDQSALQDLIYQLKSTFETSGGGGGSELRENYLPCNMTNVDNKQMQMLQCSFPCNPIMSHMNPQNSYNTGPVDFSGLPYNHSYNHSMSNTNYPAMIPTSGYTPQSMFTTLAPVTLLPQEQAQTSSTNSFRVHSFPMPSSTTASESDIKTVSPKSKAPFDQGTVNMERDSRPFACSDNRKPDSSPNQNILSSSEPFGKNNNISFLNNGQQSNQSISGKPLSEIFKPFPGSWECDSCYVRNLAKNSVCESCSTPNPNNNNNNNNKSENSLVDTSFKFGTSVKSATKKEEKVPDGKSLFGNTQNNISPAKGIFSIENLNLSEKTQSSNFSFSLNKSENASPLSNEKPVFGTPLASFKFGSSNSFKFNFNDLKPKENVDNDEISILYVKEPKSKEAAEKAKKYKLPINFYSYEDKESCSGCIGCKYEKEEEHEEQEEEDEKNPDANDSSSTAHFKPVVPLPDLVEVKSGEEDETPIFVNRAKLYRFDNVSKEWKEKGIGDFKILKHNISGRYRLLLRRYQVLKIACNHYITEEINFSIKGKTPAACWYANDFSDGVATPETFTIKFKNTSILQEFLDKIDEIKKELRSKASTKNEITPPVVSSKNKESIQTEKQIQSDVEKLCIESKNDNDKKVIPESPKSPDISEKGKNVTTEKTFGIFGSFANNKPIESTGNLFADALATQGTVTSSWSSGKNQIVMNTVPTKVFSDSNEDDYVDVKYTPIGPMPELVDVKTGEENETPLFVQRARLYRFDNDSSEWKERGIGEFKILKDNTECRYRLLLRRDKVLKIACNHLIHKNMVFNPMPHSDCSISWFARDYSEGEPVDEKFAIRFKTKDLLEEFLEKIKHVKEILDKKT